MGGICPPLLGIDSRMRAGKGGHHPTDQHADGSSCCRCHTSTDGYPNATQTYANPRPAYAHIGAIG